MQLATSHSPLVVRLHRLNSIFQHYEGTGRKLIGSLSAASNITGVLTDTNAFSALLHSYGALSFWDYATAG